ncbi:Carbon-nitrogen hydrolase [Geosmithia morbida]|uniref:Carbon-nitrogen hydrolase n=1 Tax=Geosmithia morbida TaxID=1094350 RepID=A0A9P4YQ50_9HYPO|nr:Carbon-nitrogen hydrolase [Geosmithia morbida]KAF4119980.1 Carbon-nitrogen hydrolase [Geosmithia morbida]
MSRLKVGLAQFRSKPLEVDGNFRTAESYIRAAAGQGCDLVVLPEYHLTSWAASDDDFGRASRYSESFVPRYQDLARTLDISIVPGTICYSHDEPASSSSTTTTTTTTAHRFRNVAHFIAAGTGEIRGTYQKRNLWRTERDDLVAGTEPHRSFDTGLVDDDGRPIRAGLLICWDLAFPEAFRQLAADGADVVIIPSYWFLDDAGSQGLALNLQSERVFLESAVTLRAFENTAAVIFCNSGGFSGVGMPFLGRLGASDEDEGLQVIDLDLGVLKKAEDWYRIRTDLTSDDWRYR